MSVVSNTNSQKQKVHLDELSPKQALILYSQYLTQYEKHEITKYKKIFYIGKGARKINGIFGGPRNGGYDEDKSRYITIMNDHIGYRYQIRGMLGQGSFGTVISAFDHDIRRNVAIKIIKNKKRFHQQALEEISILEQLRSADPGKIFHCVSLVNHFLFRNHICLVFPLMGKNLYELIRERRNKGFDLETVKNYSIQILSALLLMFKENLIHCDLKPENVLVSIKDPNKIKVIDFGSSCSNFNKVYTYIQSRFYRAPEIMLGVPYNQAIDMWSFGCILYEIATGVALFQGTDEHDQMAVIMSYKGFPPAKLLKFSRRYCGTFEQSNGATVLTAGKNKTGKIRELPGERNILGNLPGCYNHEYLDLLDRCLEYHPGDRLKPPQALCHPWLGFDINNSEIHQYFNQKFLKHRFEFI